MSTPHEKMVDVSSSEPTAPEQTASSALLSAIRAGDAQALVQAWDQVNQLQQSQAAAVVAAIRKTGSADTLVQQLMQISRSSADADSSRRAAEAAFAFGNDTLAIESAQETLRRDPKNGNATFILAVCANRQAKPDQALKVINDLVAVVPAAADDPLLLVQKAMAELASGDARGALKTIDDRIALLTAAGTGFDAQVIRGRAVSVLPDQAKDGLGAWQTAMSLAQPAQAEAVRVEYSAVLAQAKQFSAALEQLDLSIRATTDPSTLRVLHQARANIYYSKGDLKAAIAAYDDQLVYTAGQDDRVNLRLEQAALELSLQDWPAAALGFDSALAEAPASDSQKRREIRTAKAAALAPYDLSLVLADLDELDKSWDGLGWPRSIDARISGLLAANKGAEALSWFETRLTETPELAAHAASHQVRAEIQLKLGQIDAAIAEYEKCLGCQTAGDERACGAAIMGAFVTQQWDKLISLYEQSSNSSVAADPAVRLIAAIAYARCEKPLKALELTETNLVLPPALALLRIQAQAEAQVRLGNYEAVLQICDGNNLQQARVNPEYYFGFQLMRVQALNQLKRYDEAQAAATEVLETHPEGNGTLEGLLSFLRIGFLIQRSLSFYQTNKLAQAHSDIDAAILSFETLRSSAALKVLAQGPEFSLFENSIWYAKGAVLEAEERRDESLAAYTRAYRVERIGSAAAIARGHGLTSIGSFAEAIGVFDVALCRARTAAERAAAFSGKGRALCRSRRFEEAIAALQAALDARLTEADDDPVVFELLGVAYDALGRHSAALSAFKRAWQLTPESKRKPNLARGVAAAYLKLSDSMAALSFIDGLPQNLREDPTLMFNRALALDSLGRRREAIKSLVCASNSGLVQAQTELNRLDTPGGLGRWTSYWSGVQANNARRAVGVMLLIIAAAGLLAPLYQWLLSSKLDWYLLMIPSVVALVLLLLPSMKSISIEAANVKLSAEPLPATGRDAATVAAPQSFNMPTLTGITANESKLGLLNGPLQF